MKIKKHNVPFLLLLVLILLNDSFYLYLTDHVNPLYQLPLTFLMVVCTIFLCKTSSRKIIREIPFVLKYLFIVCASFLCVYTWSWFVYNDQSLIRTFIGDSGHYKILLVLLLYPLINMCYINHGTKILFQLLNVFAIVNYILTTIQFVTYSINGVVFLPGYFVNDAALTLNGTLKMNLPWFSNIMVLYNFYIAVLGGKTEFTKRKKLFHLGVLILGLFDCIVVARARGVILCLGAAMVLMILFDKNTISGIFKKMLCVAIVLSGVFITGTIIDFFESFSVTATRAYSTTARIYAIDYYWNYFIEHPFCGFGFADYINHYSILHGDGRVAVSDVGIFGQLAKYGIFLVPIYIWPMVRSYKTVKSVLRSNCMRNKMFYLGMFAYFVVGSFSMIAIDQFRMVSWPFFLTFMEIANLACRNNTVINDI